MSIQFFSVLFFLSLLCSIREAQAFTNQAVPLETKGINPFFPLETKGTKTTFSLGAKGTKPTFLLDQEKPLFRGLSGVKSNTGYAKAQEYFAKRRRPLRHFLDIGLGATLIESFYPFELTAYPFSVYVNYRRERWGQLKLPLLLSLKYAPLFNRWATKKIYTLVGFRYPVSHDLTLFHMGFRVGVSIPLDFSFKIHKPALELRFLLTHIIGPKDSAHRLYVQWGPKASITTKQFRAGLIAHIGLDNHL